MAHEESPVFGSYDSEYRHYNIYEASHIYDDYCQECFDAGVEPEDIYCVELSYYEEDSVTDEPVIICRYGSLEYCEEVAARFMSGESIDEGDDFPPESPEEHIEEDDDDVPF